MPDGVNTMLISAKLGSKCHPVVFIGGRCSLTALNENGTEVFWTVVGESVMSLAVIETDSGLDGSEDCASQLVIGSEDYRIRIMQDNMTMVELIETEVVLFSSFGSRLSFSFVHLGEEYFTLIRVFGFTNFSKKIICEADK